MVLSISTTHRPATDLGYLLHKNPSRVHACDMSFGKAYVLFPEVSDERCTASVLLDVDPVALVRGRRDGLFDQYVNDRPYVASSMLTSTLTEFFSTTMSGRSKERPELASQAIPLEVHLPVLACFAGEALLRRLFEPLGYEIEATRLPLDEKFSDWGESQYFDVRLKYVGRLADLLSHLYVLIPVLDNEKHYFVDRQEIDRLLRRGKEWLSTHPARVEIARRYLRYDRILTREAMSRLLIEEGDLDADEKKTSTEEKVEKRISLHDIRLAKVAETLAQLGAKSVLDLGCGEGKLLKLLLKNGQFERILGMDVAISSLERAKRALRFDWMSPHMAKRIQLIHGSLMYRDARLEGFDAAAVVEVIEHMDAPRLAAFERVVFQCARPVAVLVTTPNREYNALFEGMEPGAMRHQDHRFEWTREEFMGWGHRVAAEHGYAVSFEAVGPEDAERGAPSQMAVFKR